jgi:glutamate synthase (NADPH/NADH) large chain
MTKAMTKYDADWAAAEAAKREWMAENGLYSETEEHSSCGVGLVVSIDGKPSRKVVENGINALKAVWHRGAVDADGKTGDGAGIHVQIPPAFFYDQVVRTGHEPRKDELMAVGQVFLPRTDFGAQETCRTIVESEVLRMGYYIYGWRHVPVDVTCLGEKANATRPEIEQIIISNSKGVDEETFERELYVIRRRIEKAAAAVGIKELYLCSLSCRSIIYKGMMLAEQVAEFYPDLKDERFESAFAIYHQRYSTNTFPQWWLAQPFRMLAHNGEINTLKGNVNWMKSHEIRLSSAYFGEMAEDIKPIIAGGASDSAALDAVFEVLVRAGRNAPMAKTMLVPEAWSNTAAELPQPWMDMYSYCNSVMEPWDGPAALAMTDGRWVCAGLDRNGLRPMRYVVTGDGLMIAGSETGMVPVDEATVVEKGRAGPRPDDRRRHGGADAVPRHGDQGRPGRRAALRGMGRQDHRPGRGDARRHGKAPVRGIGPAPPPGGRGLFHRGAGTDPRADGRGREGNAGLHGRRHARGGAVEPVSPAQPLFPAELQPGHEPAHRQRCANTG